MDATTWPGCGLNSWSCDQSRRKNDALTHSATLPIGSNKFEGFVLPTDFRQFTTVFIFFNIELFF